MTTENPSDYIETTVEVFQTFDAMGLKNELLRSIYSFGFETPSEIQKKAIVPLMQGKNVIAQSPSGTGKTAAFAIGTLQQIEVEKKVCQAILLSPTRDLTLHTQEVIKNLAQYLDIEIFACIGGTSVRETIEILKKGVHIVVGTPGRVVDMIEREVIDTKPIKVLVLDEADEMLSKGFKDQVYAIMKTLPPSTHVGIFGSIIPQEAYDLTNLLMDDTVEILTKKEETKLEGIKQFYIDVNKEEFKIDTLVDLYDVVSVNQSVIFCNSKERVEYIARKLASHNYPVTIYHEAVSMEDRTKNLTEFKQGSTRILIATDILGRGIDTQQVSLVINFDMPTSDEMYIHRIGRSARFGRKGVAINFITSEEMERINTLQTTYDTKIVPLPKTFMDYL